ncbi:glycogen debranching protein GlgX [Crenothrix polyspora]|uniref:Glycogen debranching enzyme n=1 Tax=Crenothrix polyspora TaxID=360316 RepID=A0A1R4HJG8_9GAMM|nr:glycogen debranching protein GlgX [Crenothrix polyspora]SJM96364.1 glycogen debranching enzyme [Crenothrix polyspora]
MEKKLYQIKPGTPYPSGSKLSHGGINFSIFSRHTTRVELLLFDSSDSAEPFQVIELQREINRTFFSWHVYILDLPVGTWYAWRMDGPNNVRETGLHFDKDKLLLDPWARAVSHKNWDRAAACRAGDNSTTAMRCVVVDDSYDWQGDTPLRVSSEKSIIYELHVGGFTKHPSSKVTHPGTFSGLIEKIPYLQELGITHVELLPVMAFDEQDVPHSTAALGLKNYWGYSTHSFFSPHPGYCVTPEQGTHIQEFRDLVKALHKAKIAIIMDVVFNHTSESGVDGPIINFRGIGDNIFYHHDKYDKSIFRDYTGCGNTINANHPLVTRFIISCLEYWVKEMHVDGFRFDLASALSRGEDGEVLPDPPVLWGIELSKRLAKTKLIAEAWDAAGLYQVGSFPGYRWAEWNGIYRDIVRRFVRGDKGVIKDLATRLCGSSDLYEHQGRLPISSINFVTCHDGFTLSDLFSYNQKHNLANGEDNRDGCNNSNSFNCGVEGATNEISILRLRRKLAKNVFAILLLSQGVPMLLAGDEILNSQQGNNNSYCQDNAISWIDWRKTQQNADILCFVRNMIALRKRHASIMRRRFLTGKLVEGRDIADITWHGIQVNKPLWDDAEARLLAFTLAGYDAEEADLHIVMNMSDQVIAVELPLITGKIWYLAVDTALASPHDNIAPEHQQCVTKPHYTVAAQSVVVLENKDAGVMTLK